MDGEQPKISIVQWMQSLLVTVLKRQAFHKLWKISLAAYQKVRMVRAVL